MFGNTTRMDTLSAGMKGAPQSEGVARKNGLRKAQVVMAVVGLVVGQAMLYHRAAPFLWILLLIVWPRWRSVFAAVLLGGVVGTAVGINTLSAVMVLGMALLIPLPWRRPRWAWARWVLVPLGACALYLPGQPLSGFQWAIAGLVGSGAVLLYWAAMRQMQVFDTGEGNQSTLIIALASTGSLVAGMEGWKVGTLAPSLFFGGVLILAAAVLNGPAGGAVAGATLGLTMAVRGTGPDDGLGILVAAGFLAGFSAERQWRLAPVGLIGGVVLYAVLVKFPNNVTDLWVSLGAACLLAEVIPGAWVQSARLWIHILVSGESADALPARLLKIAGVMQEMAHAFQIEEEDEGPEVNLVEAVVMQVCRKCSLYRSCWEDEFYRSYRGVLDLNRVPSSDVLTTEDLGADLHRRCIRPDTVIQIANTERGKERERARFRLRVKESRALAERQLDGLAGLIKEMAGNFAEQIPPKQSVRKAKPALDCAVGVAKRPRRGGVVSGDSELICTLPRDNVVFGLSDGMGVGPRAAWESGTAMALLEKLLLAGFSQVLAVQAVNTTLLLRSVEDHFATLDLILIDRVARGAEIVKVAASPTFLLRQGRVEIIRSHNLPVGILQDVQVDPIYHTLESGDLLVMVTDGALEGEGIDGELALRELLREIPRQEPQVMAETILSYLLGNDQDGRDDAAVMVIQLLGHGQRPKSVAEESGHLTREWQRLTPEPLKARP